MWPVQHEAQRARWAHPRPHAPQVTSHMQARDQESRAPAGSSEHRPAHIRSRLSAAPPTWETPYSLSRAFQTLVEIDGGP